MKTLMYICVIYITLFTFACNNPITPDPEFSIIGHWRMTETDVEHAIRDSLTSFWIFYPDNNSTLIWNANNYFGEWSDTYIFTESNELYCYIPVLILTASHGGAKITINSYDSFTIRNPHDSTYWTYTKISATHKQMQNKEGIK